MRRTPGAPATQNLFMPDKVVAPWGGPRKMTVIASEAKPIPCGEWAEIASRGTLRNGAWKKVEDMAMLCARTPGQFLAESWIWREVKKALWAAGHEVFTPSLTGMGERVHLANPDIDLSTLIQDVVNEMTYSNLYEVILVGFSFSGMVITGVAEKEPERISQLVYLDAYVPEDGQSAADLTGPEASAMVMQSTQAYGEGWKMFPGDPSDLPDNSAA